MDTTNNHGLTWVDERHAFLTDDPKIRLIFSDEANEEIVDKALGFLIRATLTND